MNRPRDEHVHKYFKSSRTCVEFAVFTKLSVDNMMNGKRDEHVHKYFKN